MYSRAQKLTTQNSFFLFGARGTGKSTLLGVQPHLKNALKIDLLDGDDEAQFSIRPQSLAEVAEDLQPHQWIVIDEIQKIPKLLDVVHQLIEKRKINFALTGSSSRKLKRGGANLLAGRAFVFSLFPLTATELNKDFKLNDILAWGSLPKIFDYHDSQDKMRYLKSYVQTYIKEEILVEQLIRKLDPFRLFLPVAAQMDGKIVNFTKIGTEAGVSHQVVQNYYQILEETYLGFFLNSFDRSIRKVQIAAPKFYFFDSGVKRCLAHELEHPIQSGTNAFGDLFESWFINEVQRRISYQEKDYRLSYLRTKDDAEIDLIIEDLSDPKRKDPRYLIEIKATDKVTERHLKHLLSFKSDFPKSECYCASLVTRSQKIEGIWVMPWNEVIKNIGL